jgi:hypothetical protein
MITCSLFSHIISTNMVSTYNLQQMIPSPSRAPHPTHRVEAVAYTVLIYFEIKRYNTSPLHNIFGTIRIGYGRLATKSGGQTEVTGQ